MIVTPTPLDQKGSKTAILQCLHKYGAITRVRLAELTGLSRATISTAVSELIGLELVRESKERLNTGGRPAVTLKLKSDTRLVIGADLDPDAWTIGVFDLRFNQIAISRVPIQDRSISSIIGLLVGQVKNFIQDFGKRLLPMIGIGLPGLIDNRNGIIISASHFGWSKVAFSGQIRKELGWPAVILNHNKARGLAECRYGAGRNYHQMIYIGVGRGIAGGIFYNRQLVEGAFNGAGEIGHITMVPNGILCSCGNQGCLQAYSSGSALELQARKRVRLSLDEHTSLTSDEDMMQLRYEKVCQAADKGDWLAREIVEECAQYLGIAMANLVNIINPEAFILGGSVPRNSKLFVDVALKTMRQRSVSQLSQSTEVNVAQFNEFGGALGAANFAMDELFSFPLCVEE
ncbi:ROK family transcriptional regulator [Paenibacillus chungangensis]|uniref:ROK family protein n=1 Tax=Paenibacillus chungangensis TaxID=696535 RepID=A0ABW3HP38_9BACL